MVTQTVVFDVGESLIDEARMWAGWARWLGVTLPTFLAALDDAIAGGRHHHEALRRFRPSLDVEVARRRRTARSAGMVAVFLERGPWGRAHALRPQIALAHVHLRDLTKFPDALA